MKLPRRSFLSLAAGAAVLPAASRIACAQAYPTRPVRLIVPFGAGGAPDILARLVGQWLSDRLGQPFIVENRPGANGNLGTQGVIEAPADGNMLLLASFANVVNTSIYQNLNFDFIRDTAPVAGISRDPDVMVVSPVVPGKISSRNSSPTPRPIRARSTWDRRASGHRRTWPANCSNSWPRST